VKFKLRYATEADVPEAVKAAYAAGADGAFYFQSDLQDDHPALETLRGALRTERTHRERAEAELAPWKELGKAPDEIKTALAKGGGAPPKGGNKDELESLRTQMQEAHAAEVQKLTERIGQLTGFVNETVGDSAVLAELAKVAPKVAHILKPHAMSRVQVMERDGRFVPVVIDPATKKVRYDANGQEFTVAKLVEEMRETPEFAPVFPGAGGAGGGADPKDQQGDGGGKKVVKASDTDAFHANLEDIAAGKVLVQ
jgi:hypothetical protein